VEPTLDPHTRGIFREALKALLGGETRFLVGGAFATHCHTGIWRNTKDLDVFCEPDRAEQVLGLLADAGFQTRVEEKHWLGKAFRQGVLVDVIWGGGNWATFVDDHWFARAIPGSILDVPVLIAPAEDMILSKAWVAGRERHDGTDICHLIRARGRDFDWDDVVARFGHHWQLLLHYLILFRFVYPEERDIVPLRVIRDLASRIGTDAELADGLPFRGPLVDRYGYLQVMRDEGLPDPGKELARRNGHDPADVERRRELDRAALEQGSPYRKHMAVAE
jgi:hypothetical protein